MKSYGVTIEISEFVFKRKKSFMLNVSDQRCRVTSAAIERRHCHPGYCLIKYRARAWHYRIFSDFLNSGFKMASKTEGKAYVIARSWNDIKGQITPES